MCKSRTTTCGVFTTLGVATAGGIATALTAVIANEKCQSALEGITSFVAQNFTIPAMTKTILVTIPQSTFEVFGQAIPIPEIERNATILIPESQINIGDALGQDNIAAINNIPGIVGETCSTNVVMHGIAYTAIATTVACTLTCLYHLNDKHKQARRHNSNNVELGMIHRANTGSRGHASGDENEAEPRQERSHSNVSTQPRRSSSDLRAKKRGRLHLSR